MEGARRRFLGNRHCEADELANNDQQGTAIIIKIFWWRNVNLCEWNVNYRKLVRKRTGLGNRHCEADELANNEQQGTAIIIKIFWWRNVNCRELNVN